VLYQRCAAAGRDPAEIRLSAQVPFTGDPAEAEAEAAAFGSAGAGLVIVSLPRRTSPACWNRWRAHWRNSPDPSRPSGAAT